MDGRISMYVLLVCVWCSLDAGGLLMVVTAQPTVSAVILTPEADRKEGGQVDMRCTATNLESDHIVAWGTEDPERILRWGNVTVTTESQFTFITTEDTTTGMTVQDFTIINVQKEDSNKYFCSVKDPTTEGVYNVVFQSSITLSVLYFPNASFPICFPAGPITVDDGTVLNISCTSESGHRAVRMRLDPTIPTAGSTPWTSQVYDDTDHTLTRSSDLTATVADDGMAINCIITSIVFPSMERSCTIGPIAVGDLMIVPVIDPDPTTTSTSMSLAFVVAMVFVVAFFVIIIILLRCIIRKNRLIKSLTAQKEYKVPQADPYMELQPTEDKNRVYMEPTTATTTTQDTYYQPVEVETDNPEYDYARPDDPNEQRMNHQVSVHVDQTSSSGATDTQHTYYQPSKVQTDSPEDDYVEPDEPKEQRMNHQFSVHVDQTSSSGATDTHYTYYQPSKVETDSPEDDYVEPDEPKEQRMNHQVSVHVDQTRSSGQLIFNIPTFNQVK